jgi:hypothetical protein
MNHIFLWIVSFLYIGQFLMSIYNKEWAEVTIFGGYAVAGFGLIWSFR